MHQVFIFLIIYCIMFLKLYKNPLVLAVNHVGLQRFRKWGQSNSSTRWQLHMSLSVWGLWCSRHEGPSWSFILIVMTIICSGRRHAAHLILISKEFDDVKSLICSVLLQTTELAGTDENDADDNSAGFAFCTCVIKLIIMQQPAPLTGCRQLICLETPTGGFYCMLDPLGVICIVLVERILHCNCTDTSSGGKTFYLSRSSKTTL